MNNFEIIGPLDLMDGLLYHIATKIGKFITTEQQFFDHYGVKDEKEANEKCQDKWKIICRDGFIFVGTFPLPGEEIFEGLNKKLIATIGEEIFEGLNNELTANYRIR